MKKYFAIVLALVLTLSNLAGCGGKLEKKAEKSVSVPDEIVDVDYAKEGEVVVAEIEGKQISDRMIMDYIVTYGTGPHGMQGQEKTIDDFLNRELAVYDVVSRGLPKMKRYAGQLRIYYLSVLGVDYAKGPLKDEIEVTGKEISDSLPEKFKVGNFDLLIFETEEEAKKALSRIKDSRTFYHFAEKNRDRLKNTGDIYPGSGFFHEFDDVALFNMKSGTFAGYYETGIGPALVSVRYVRELTPDEISKLVEERRKELVERKIPALIEDILSRHRVSVDKDKIYELAEKEVELGISPILDQVVASVDDIVITYLNVKRWLKRDYREYLKNLSGRDLGRLMANDTDNLVKQVVLGLEAEKKGYKITDENNKKAFDELKRRYYYLVGILDYLGGEIKVTEEEARKFYEDNFERLFKVPESMKVAHIFTRRFKKARDIYKKLKSGEKFEELAKKYSEDASTRDSGGLIGVIKHGGKIMKDIQDELFKPEYKKPGAVTDILISREGYHIFKVYEYFPEKIYPFEKMKDRIYSAIRSMKFQEGKDKYLQSLRNKYKVVKYEDRLEKLNKKIEEFFKEKKARKFMPH